MSRRNYWRDSSRTARFWIFDARAGVALFVFFMHWSWLTFKIAIIAFVLFATLERFGFTAIVAYRWARSRLAGPIRQAMPWWRRPRR